jgi:hypothetical protein
MNPRTIAVAAATLIGVVGFGAVAAWGVTDRTEALDAPPTDVPGGIPAEAIPDGQQFAFVTLASTPDDDRVVIRIDPAEMLTGTAAHDAAVEAGVIATVEELPNDIFIADPDPRTRTIALHDDAAVTVQIASAGEPLRPFEIRPGELYDAFDGALAAGAVYGIIPGEPVAMTLTVERGFVVSAAPVFLP